MATKKTLTKKSAKPKAKTGKPRLAAAAKADQENARLRDERTKPPVGKTNGKGAMAQTAPAKEPLPSAPPKVQVPIRGNGRIAMAQKTDAELDKIARQLPTSTGHIAFTRNGNVHEVYFRVHNGSPAAWKVLAAAPVADSGYREDKAALIATGADGVRDLIKRLTGRSPSQISIGIKAPGANRAGSGAKRGPKREGLSVLDAAAQVLGESKDPMNCAAMVKLMLEKKLWTTKGKTPAATLYSAILREVQTKGAAARFKKAGKGTFTLAAGA